MDQRLEIVSGVCLMFFADLIFFDSSIKSSSSQLRKFFGQSRLTYPDDSRFSQAWDMDENQRLLIHSII